MRVVVVGTGIAGLAAVHELNKKGVDVIALEKNDRAGGRLYSVKRDGYTMDAGAQWMLSCYDYLLRLCKEINLEDEIIKLPMHGCRIAAGNKAYPIGLSLNPRVLTGPVRYFLKALGIKSVLDLVRFSAHLMNRWKDLSSITDHNLWDLDNESFAEFALRKTGEGAFENILQPAVSSPIFSEPEDIGAAMGALCVTKLASAVFKGLFVMKNGIGTITERLQEMYSDHIRLSTPAKEILIKRNAVKGVVTEGKFYDADAVICATTATKALEITPAMAPVTRDALEKAAYSACCHVMFAVENVPFRKGEYGIIFPRRSGSPMAVITSSRTMEGYAVPEGDLIHCFTYGNYSRELNAMSDGEIVLAARRLIKNYAPKLIDRVRFFDIRRFDEAVFLSPPGTLKTLKEASKECPKYDKGLYLAGEYLGVGCLEVAAHSGLDAANRVTHDYR